MKIKVNIDGAGTDPYIFKAFMPTGPACRYGIEKRSITHILPAPWIGIAIKDYTTPCNP